MSDLKYYAKRYYIITILLTLNIIVHVMQFFWGDAIYGLGCLDVINVIEQKQFYRIFTCNFIHADLSHLAGNMIFLVALGQMLEDTIGHLKFCIVYLAAGITGSVFSLMQSWLSGEYYLSVGASGAVFGLVGALLFMVIMNNGRFANISLSRILLAVVYIVYSGMRTPYIDNAAHIGGIIGGVLFMMLIYIFGCVQKGRINFEN